MYAESCKLNMNNNKIRSANVIHKILLNELKLPEVIDGMAMLQVDSKMLESSPCTGTEETSPEIENDQTSSSSKRVLRKRNLSTGPKETLKKRVHQKPRKRSHAEMESEKDVHAYYLNKHINAATNSLETIFEEDTNENSIRIGKRKLKRLINFNGSPYTAKLKLKKRHAKLKSLGKSPYKKSRISMDAVIDKLHNNQSDSTNNTEMNVS